MRDGAAEIAPERGQRLAVPFCLDLHIRKFRQKPRIVALLLGPGKGRDRRGEVAAASLDPPEQQYRFPVIGVFPADGDRSGGIARFQKRKRVAALDIGGFRRPLVRGRHDGERLLILPLLQPDPAEPDPCFGKVVVDPQRPFQKGDGGIAGGIAALHQRKVEQADGVGGITGCQGFPYFPGAGDIPLPEFYNPAIIPCVAVSGQQVGGFLETGQRGFVLFFFKCVQAVAVQRIGGAYRFHYLCRQCIFPQ